ncbi:uncharacterized protein LOC121176758 [Toxotes jaculatrix]|uniref:uncharacterized protein LOC121176758 n=1 Tax=Toxotes jaculatrix TaxID=941984 RepID=UPI001B3A99EE|nr:uncharacterized protein LOC121176758 [Toxotes jaculatrix]
MFRSCDLFALGCLFLMVESHAGQILPPRNLSLQWGNDFYPELTWVPPQHSDLTNCTYEVRSKYSAQDELLDIFHPSHSWTKYIVMEGGSLNLSVETVCNDKKSDPVTLNVSYPVMVKNLQCYIHSSKDAYCFWEPANNPSVFGFFYRLLEENFSKSDNDKSPLPRLQECSSYNYTDGVRTGCHLQASIQHSIDILFNGTVNNTFFRNTFKKYLFNDVRPPPLKWTVKKNGNKFEISWTPLDIGVDDVKYIINYTECTTVKTQEILGRTSTELDVLPECPYRMAIKAENSRLHISTPWSDEKHFDADKDPNALVYAAVVIPLMFAGLAALIFLCYRKNKEQIFPKVPQPRDFLSDICDNNNKSTVCNLYVPRKEEENCKITLVMKSTD